MTLDHWNVPPGDQIPAFAERAVRDNDFVLVVCTEVYRRRFDGTEDKGRGLGSRWEGAILTQVFYDAAAETGKLVPVVFSAEAAKLLIQRRVSGLGCDTLSIDHGASSDYPVHHVALGAGLYQLENLADLSELPERGAFLIVAPIKLEGG